MKTIFVSIAAGVVLAGAVQADQFTDSIVSDLQGQGFSYIEVKQGPTQVKVEAVRGGSKLEVVYDRSTGKILKQETGAVDDDYSGRSGVEISTRDRSFVDDSGRRRGGDDDDDDDRSGRGGGGDDHDDDRSGRGGGDDHGDDDRSGRGGGGDDHGDDDSDRGGGGDDDDSDDD